MATLRSYLAWFLLGWLVLAIALFLSLGVLFSAGRLRERLVDLALPLFWRSALWMHGIKVEITGREHFVGKRPRVMVFNHASTLDIFLICAPQPPAPTPIAKREFRWIFPLNLTFWAAGVVFLDRRHRDKAVASLGRVAERLRSEGRTILMAPEGTRSLDGRLARFKHGPFHLSQQAQAEIVPVVVHGAWHLCRPGSLRVKPGTVRIEIKPPWPPSTDPAADAERLHAAYAGWLAAG